MQKKNNPLTIWVAKKIYFCSFSRIVKASESQKKLKSKSKGHQNLGLDHCLFT
jgi:hypothetical protein